MAKIYDFSRLADQLLVAEVEKETRHRKSDFFPKLMRYQIKHYEKYNRYLIF
jgi:hypothetical protein